MTRPEWVKRIPDWVIGLVVWLAFAAALLTGIWWVLRTVRA